MKFRCSTNPNFTLRKRGLVIQFADGEYKTTDGREIALLQSSPHVKEVKQTKRGRKTKKKSEPTGSEKKAGETGGAGEVEGPSFA